MGSLRRRVVLGVLLLTLGGGGALVVWLVQGGDATAVSRAAPPAPRQQPVIAGRVEQQAMPVQLSAIGTVSTVYSVAVHTRLDSQITRVFVEDGQHVEAGAKLFELDSRQLRAQRAHATAVLKRDRFELELARRSLARRNPQIDSESVMDEARIGVASREASVAADEADLRNLDVQLSYALLRAPISGRLGSIAYKTGSNVKVSDSQPLVTINQLRPVYVAFSLPQRELGRLQERLAAGPVPAEATVPGGQGPPLQGQVAFLENAVDPGTGTILVKARFPNEKERLWPGAYVDVVVTLSTEPRALVIPTRAVQSGQAGPYVFIIQDDHTVAIRPVRVARAVGEESVIAEGLRAGEQIVVDGQLRLISGTPVTFKEPPPQQRP